MHQVVQGFQSAFSYVLNSKVSPKFIEIEIVLLLAQVSRKASSHAFPASNLEGCLTKHLLERGRRNGKGGMGGKTLP